MSKTRIKDFIARRTERDGLTQTGIAGVQLFRATDYQPDLVFDGLEIMARNG